MRVVRTPTAVDFPAPFGPNRPNIWPGGMSRQSLSKAIISAFLFLEFPPGPEKVPVLGPSGDNVRYVLHNSLVRTPAPMLDDLQLLQLAQLRLPLPFAKIKNSNVCLNGQEL